MEKIVEYTGANHGVSPATVELLIRERNKGRSLRQLGQMFGRSHERIRQVLAKYGSQVVTLLPEKRVAAKLGYLPGRLARLRRKGIINPVRPGVAGFILRSKSDKYHHLLPRQKEE